VGYYSLLLEGRFSLYLLDVRTSTLVVSSFVASKTSDLTFVSFSSGVVAGVWKLLSDLISSHHHSLYSFGD
jgi:hypothetical protein